MKIYLKKILGGLAPADDEATEALKKYKVGAVVSAEIKKPRNYEFHKKAFALFQLIYENQEKYETMKDLLTEIKLRCGWYEEHVSMNGVVIYVPKSISFASMDDLEFSTFYDRAINVALKYFLVGSTKEEIDSWVNTILSFD